MITLVMSRRGCRCCCFLQTRCKAAVTRQLSRLGGKQKRAGIRQDTSKHHKMEGFPADICSVELCTIVTYSHYHKGRRRRFFSGTVLKRIRWVDGQITYCRICEGYTSLSVRRPSIRLIRETYGCLL